MGSDRLEGEIACPFFRGIKTGGNEHKIQCSLNRNDKVKLFTVFRDRKTMKEFAREKCYEPFPDECDAYNMLMHLYDSKNLPKTAGQCALLLANGKCSGTTIYPCMGKDCKFYKEK